MKNKDTYISSATFRHDFTRENSKSFDIRRLPIGKHLCKFRNRLLPPFSGYFKLNISDYTEE